MPSSFKKWQKSHPEYAQNGSAYKKQKNINDVNYNFNTNLGTQAAVVGGTVAVGAAAAGIGAYLAGRYIYNKATGAYEATKQSIGNAVSGAASAVGGAVGGAAGAIHSGASEAVTPMVSGQTDMWGNYLYDNELADEEDFFDAEQGPSYSYNENNPDLGDWEETGSGSWFGGWFGSGY